MSKIQETLNKLSAWTKDRITNSKNWLKKSVGSIKQHTRAQYEKVKTSVINYKKALIISGASLAIIASAGGVGYTYYVMHVQPIYHVYFHGNYMGTVENPDLVYEWMEDKIEEESSKYEHLDITVDAQFVFEEEEQYKPEFDHESTFANLESEFALKASAIRVEIDGQFIGYAPDEETLSELLDALKHKYVSEEMLATLEENNEKKPTVAVAAFEAESPLDSQEEITPVIQEATLAQRLALDEYVLTEAKIKQNIEVENVEVHPQQVLDIDQLKEKMFVTKEEQVNYYVQKGDVLGTIAQDHGLSLKELLALNPQVDENSILQIGQELVVKAEVPLLSVVTVENIKREQGIAYPVEIEYSDEMYKGDSKVIQPGKEGKKYVVYQITKENGEVVDKQIVEEEVLVEPEAEVKLVGTKVKPSRGTGQFQWPTIGGQITSGFGMRWGRAHNGIDIAGVRDRSILASDNGVVTTARYHNGGYGNYIIIDHDNGYQTLYAHLSSINVSVGQVVMKGEKIGVMGSTGNSTGIHLHFEVHVNGSPVNPLQYVSR